MEHRVPFKVYYEDTDCLGIVYYANYLKFMERGRSEFLAAHGGSVADLNRDGYVILVQSLHVTYHRPAELGDVLDVVSSFSLSSRFRGVFHQRIERAGELDREGSPRAGELGRPRAGELLVEADVNMVCLDADRKLTSFPALLRELAAQGGADNLTAAAGGGARRRAGR